MRIYIYNIGSNMSLNVAAVSENDVNDNAQVSRDFGAVYIYGPCVPYSSIRQYKTAVVTSDMNPGALHPYGIALDSHGNVYTSFQHSDAILRFNASHRFTPIPSPSSLASFFISKLDPVTENNSSTAEGRKEDGADGDGETDDPNGDDNVSAYLRGDLI
mmetsp:Transcript_3626/g.5443  ORF Transcript_3626/g.5443 Transcript_3626/m.5443 type:complete len:159 (+) Transcript_3626:62-538(+)